MRMSESRSVSMNKLASVTNALIEVLSCLQIREMGSNCENEIWKLVNEKGETDKRGGI